MPAAPKKKPAKTSQGKTKSTKKTSSKQVMDVHKPGKSAPSASSRPVIVGHAPTVKDPMVNEDKKMPPEDEKDTSEEHKIEVKRTGPKVIKPLSSSEEIAKEAEAGKTDDEPGATADSSDQGTDTAPVMPAMPVGGSESSSDDTDSKIPSTNDEPEEDIPEEHSDVGQTDEETPATEEEPIDDAPAATGQTDDNSSPDTSSKGPKESKGKGGSSVVDAVAGAAAKNKDKQADKKNEELQKRLAEIEKLVDEKKYFVHTSTTTKKERKTRWIALIVLVLLLAGSYLAVDAQVVKNDIKLPYEFFKEEPQPEPAVIEEDSSEEEPEEVAPAEEEDEVEEPASAQARARDTERKNELKTLQQNLESYFNDNGTYPAADNWETEIAATEDELTDPDGEAYTYTPSADNSSYTLSAVLENSDDPDAGADGKYTLQSANQ